MDEETKRREIEARLEEERMLRQEQERRWQEKRMQERQRMEQALLVSDRPRNNRCRPCSHTSKALARQSTINRRQRCPGLHHRCHR